MSISKSHPDGETKNDLVTYWMCRVKRVCLDPYPKTMELLDHQGTYILEVIL